MEVETTEPGPATDEAQLVMDTAKGRAKVGAKGPRTGWRPTSSA